jgi:hypothetical protein
MIVQCRVVAFVVLFGLTTAAPHPSAAPVGFSETVRATHPTAFYRLTGKTGSSEVGGTTYSLSGNGAASTNCPPIGVSGDHCVFLDGQTGYFETTQQGGIGRAGSILAWVNMAQIPNTVGRISYVAGMSERGNDFDLQFEPDNTIKFYTASGSNVSYAPPYIQLSGEWHMIVGTFDADSGRRALYWDGVLAQSDSGGGKPGKHSALTVGESKVFTGRFLWGIISDVAVWRRALTAKDVAAIYASRT